jgi:hypothetical protein
MEQEKLVNALIVELLRNLDKMPDAKGYVQRFMLEKSPTGRSAWAWPGETRRALSGMRSSGPSFGCGAGFAECYSDATALWIDLIP